MQVSNLHAIKNKSIKTFLHAHVSWNSWDNWMFAFSIYTEVSICLRSLCDTMVVGRSVLRQQWDLTICEVVCLQIWRRCMFNIWHGCIASDKRTSPPSVSDACHAAGNLDASPVSTNGSVAFPKGPPHPLPHPPCCWSPASCNRMESVPGRYNPASERDLTKNPRHHWQPPRFLPSFSPPEKYKQGLEGSSHVLAAAMQWMDCWSKTLLQKPEKNKNTFAGQRFVLQKSLSLFGSDINKKNCSDLTWQISPM